MKTLQLIWIIGLIGLLGISQTSAHSPRSAADANWAVGLQGNFPLWGGLSLKYTGLKRVQFQFIEHYVQNADEYSAMIGFQLPIVVADYGWSRVYLAPGIGFRTLNEKQIHYVPSGDGAVVPPYHGEDRELQIRRTVTESIVGGAMLFGAEFFLDKLLGSKGARYGVNIEFGQGIGQLDRQASCEDIADGSPIDCDLLYARQPWLEEESSEKEGKGRRASFVVGFGFHIYF